MDKKSADTIRLAERLIVASMTDAQIDAWIAENPDPEFQALLEDMSIAELEPLSPHGAEIDAERITQTVIQNLKGMRP